MSSYIVFISCLFFTTSISMLAPVKAMTEDEERRVGTAAILPTTKTPISDGLNYLRKNQTATALKFLLPYAHRSPLARAACLKMDTKLEADPLDTHRENTCSAQIAAIVWASKTLWGRKKVEEKIFKKVPDYFKTLEVAYLYEAKKDKKNAAKWYAKAAEKENTLETRLGLGRVLEDDEKKKTKAYDTGDITVHGLQVYYNVALAKNLDEAAAFWAVAQELETKGRAAVNNWLYTACMKASAVYGHFEAQNTYACGLLTLNKNEEASYWAVLGTRGEYASALQKIIEKNPLELTCLDTLPQCPSAHATDYLWYARLVAKDSPDVWFEQAIEKYQAHTPLQEFVIQVEKFIEKAQWQLALAFLQKINHFHSSRVPTAKYYEVICKASVDSDGDGTTIFQAFQKAFPNDLEAFKIFFSAWKNAWIVPDFKAMLPVIEKFSQQWPEDRDVSFMQAVAFLFEKKLDAAKEIFDRPGLIDFVTQEDKIFFYLEYLYQRGLCEEGEEEAKKVFEIYKKIYEKAPKNGELSFRLYTLAQQLKQGNLEAYKAQWLQTAAEANIPEACSRFGWSLYSKEGSSEAEKEEGMRYLTIGRQADCSVALCYYFIMATEEGEEKAKEFWKSCSVEQQEMLAPLKEVLDKKTGEQECDSPSEEADVTCESCPVATAPAVPINSQTSNTPQPTTPAKKTAEAKCVERKLTAEERLTGKRGMKKRKLLKLLNEISKSAPVHLEPGSGSRYYFQVGNIKGGFHMPHGSTGDMMDRSFLKKFAQQVRVSLGKE